MDAHRRIGEEEPPGVLPVRPDPSDDRSGMDHVFGSGGLEGGANALRVGQIVVGRSGDDRCGPAFLDLRDDPTP
jgi:hypothetical protein